MIVFGYNALIDGAMAAKLEKSGIEIEGLAPDDAAGIVSTEAPAQLRRYVIANPEAIGTTQTFEFLTNGRVDQYFKGRVSMESAARDASVSPEQLQLAESFREEGSLVSRFNWSFITAPDASDQRPEAAGLGIAILGSAYMMIIVLCLALPIGVAASIYLEEFAPTNQMTDLIEVNISNLAAVPSIVFGILGLAIFINFMALPQSAPIVGGLG